MKPECWPMSQKFNQKNIDKKTIVKDINNNMTNEKKLSYIPYIGDSTSKDYMRTVMEDANEMTKILTEEILNPYFNPEEKFKLVDSEFLC